MKALRQARVEQIYTCCVKENWVSKRCLINRQFERPASEKEVICVCRSYKFVSWCVVSVCELDVRAYLNSMHARFCTWTRGWSFCFPALSPLPPMKWWGGGGSRGHLGIWRQDWLLGGRCTVTQSLCSELHLHSASGILMFSCYL